jgi:hypothetical protein
MEAELTPMDRYRMGAALWKRLFVFCVLPLSIFTVLVTAFFPRGGLLGIAVSIGILVFGSAIETRIRDTRLRVFEKLVLALLMYVTVFIAVSVALLATCSALMNQWLNLPCAAVPTGYHIRAYLTMVSVGYISYLCFYGLNSFERRRQRSKS